MKKVFAGLLIALALHTGAHAQEARQRRTPEERAQQQVERMQPLKLTEEQKQKLYDFNLKIQAGVANGAHTTQAEKREHRNIMRAEREAAYQQILTKEQYAELQQLRTERMKERTTAE